MEWPIEEEEYEQCVRIKSYKKKIYEKDTFSGCSFTWGESIELENSKYLELLKSGDVIVKHDLGFYTGYQHGSFS